MRTKFGISVWSLSHFIFTDDVQNNWDTGVSGLFKAQCSSHKLLLNGQSVLKPQKRYLKEIQNKFEMNIKNDADIHLISGICCLSVVLVAIILKTTWCWQIQLICASRDKYYYWFALEHASRVGQRTDKPGTEESWIRSELSGSEVSWFGSVTSCGLLLLPITPLSLMLLMLLCPCNSSLLAPSGAPCKQSTLLPPGSTSFLGTREAKQRQLQSQDSYHTTWQKTNVKRTLACLLLYCNDAIRTHRSLAGFGSHTCAGWNELLL